MRHICLSKVYSHPSSFERLDVVVGLFGRDQLVFRRYQGEGRGPVRGDKVVRVVS